MKENFKLNKCGEKSLTSSKSVKHEEQQNKYRSKAWTKEDLRTNSEDSASDIKQE